MIYFVYILESKLDRSRYVGYTNDLKRRLAEHNGGNSAYSSLKRPYTIKWYAAFSDKEKVVDFEKYLKSSSGYASTQKHLI